MSEFKRLPTRRRRTKGSNDRVDVPTDQPDLPPQVADGLKAVGMIVAGCVKLAKIVGPLAGGFAAAWRFFAH